VKLIKKFTSSGLVWLWLAILVIALDRYTKLWVVQHLTLHEPLILLPVFDLTLAYNTGASFSLLDSMSGWQNIFLGSLAFVVSLGVLWWLATTPARSRWLCVALCLVLAGALGNAWDRILYGHVIDFLSFHWGAWYFAIFNVADSAICIAAFMLFWHWLRHTKSE
jgi:signal peptidase II